jgi:hypothetical protein
MKRSRTPRMRSVLLIGSLTAISLSFACAKKSGPVDVAAMPPAEAAKQYPNLAIQAKQLNEAFGKRDFARFVDFIHPKVVEMAGGRDTMVTDMTREIKQMELEGVVILSSESNAPTQFVRDGGSIYAVLPTITKTRTQTGVFQSESNMIAVSSDEGANWKFIDASGQNNGELNKLIPGVADKLKLPPDKTPVKISN